MKSNKSIAIALGLLSTVFFAATFIINRLIAIEGGHWVWSASLRFFWMFPFLLILVFIRGGLKSLLVEIKKMPWQWILWSSIGFGIFYAPLTFAAAYGPSWLVASTWELTIIMGMLISPIINKTSFKNILSIRTLLFSSIILLGIIIMQVQHAQVISIRELLLGTIPVIIATIAYPLGNRKMMHILDGKLNSLQRTLGMTIASLPFWVVLSCYGFIQGGFPAKAQISQTLVVAISSGVIATVLFFMATDKVRKDEQALAAVEATQSGEIVFTLIGEVMLLHTTLPNIYSMIGIVLVIGGMVLHSLSSTNLTP